MIIGSASTSPNECQLEVSKLPLGPGLEPLLVGSGTEWLDVETKWSCVRVMPERQVSRRPQAAGLGPVAVRPGGR